MTTDEEKDPPIPEDLEGITLKRVHDHPADEQDTDASPDKNPEK